MRRSGASSNPTHPTHPSDPAEKPTPPDTGTLLIRCADWRDPLFRVHGCGYSRLMRPGAETHLDWGVLEPFAQLRVVLRGELRLRVGAEAVDLQAGSALSLLLPAREVRLEVVQPPVDLLWVQLEGRAALGWIAEIQKEVGILQGIPTGGAATRGLRRIVREAAADPVRDAFHWSDRGHALLRDWWAESLSAERERREHLVGSGSRPLPVGMRRRVTRMPPPEASHLPRTTPRTVAEFAERLGYSRSHLSTVLSASWQESPAAVLRRDRMERARELLRRGRSVAEIADAAGYASYQTFSRAYRRHFGVLPSRDREASPPG